MKAYNNLIILGILIIFLSQFEISESSSKINNAYMQKRAKELYKKQRKNQKRVLAQRKGNGRKLAVTNTKREQYTVFERCDQGHQPDCLSDCTQYSNETSSCCYFTYGNDIGCIYVPFRYLGSKTVGDMKVNCHCNFLKSFNFIISIFALILILF